MSMLRNEQEAQQQEQRESSTESSLSSTSNSISLIKLDELSSFGATKQSRLPALIKLNPLADQNSRDLQQQPQPQQGSTSSNSMPDFSGSQVEKMVVSETTTSGGATVTVGQQSQQQSLPVDLHQVLANKENTVEAAPRAASSLQEQTKSNQDDSVDDFQVVEMEQLNTLEGQMVGPSLPQQVAVESDQQQQQVSSASSKQQQLFHKSLAAASLVSQRGEQYASHLGDSLIEMIINLRNENQNLVKALEVNNDYVKGRLDEFKRCQEEAKKRESEHQLEKAELEHNLRKVQRQNGVLSERLKSMEQKLKELKLEVSGTLSAAHSSKASSIHDGEPNLYPQLGDSGSFANSALLKASEAEANATTMQVDAASGELYNEGDHQSRSSATSAAAMDTSDQQTAAKEVAGMSRDELSKRFDAKKVDFYAIDDPMKQCDQLEQQLNDIGKRDYEICLLQQQLNIYRQDFRLERMAKLEAKIQIEKLKNEIDRLCLDRLTRANEEDLTDDDQQQQSGHNDNLIGKLGHHLSRKALKSAAKAAKYASKQAHLEEKAAAALARAAAAKASAASHFAPTAGGSSTEGSGAEQAPHQGPSLQHHHHSRRHHRHHHHHAPPHPPHHRQSAGRSIRGEIVNDLMSTANKAMLTGYNLASTTINSALDKLSQFEQQQAAQATDPNRPRPGVPYPTPGGAQQQHHQNAKPSAPPMDSHLSVD